MFLKLTTICDVSHVISFTKAFLSLIFSHKRGRPGDEAKPGNMRRLQENLNRDKPEECTQAE